MERAHRKRGLKVELIELKTTGDRDRASALKTFGGAGVFVKELEQALLDGRVDFAVHSLKDLPTKQPRGLTLAAVSRREDVRDVAVTRGGKRLAELPEGAVIGSGSPRRRAQLALKFPHLRFAEIRGNVETRLQKVADGAYAGTILARAGLKRLGRRERDAEVLSLAAMLPAPGQGALGIECRSSDRATREFLAVLHDADSAACVAAERACLAALGGGCHLPLGACGRIDRKTGQLTLDAVLALPDGTCAARASVRGRARDARKLGRSCAQAIKRSQEGREVLRRLES